MAGAARHLTPVVLELGGKSPAIVLADADIEVAVRRIAWVKLLNSGQTCIAPDYVLVERSVRDRVVDRLQHTISEFRADQSGGQRIVNERQYDRIAASVGDAGGRVVAGGQGDRAALTYEPTIVVDPDPDSELMTAEIFGSVLAVVTVDSLDDAIARVNSGSKPLAAYVFTSSGRSARRMLDEVSSGGAVINHVAMHCLVPQLPFGGVGTSGMGSYHGRWGFETFSHRKAVLSKSTEVDPGLMYPPYSERDR